MTSAHAEMGDERQREFRKMIGWSIGAHLFVVFAAVVMPHPSGRIDPSQVVSVDLVAIPAPARASAPPKPAAPKPQETAAVKPPPPPPPKKEIIIPEHSERDPEKKPKPEPEKAEPAPEPEKDLEDLLAEMRQDAGEAEPTEEPAPEETAAAEPSPSSGGTVAVSPEVLAWIRKAKVHVRRSWVVPPGFRTESLETHVTVELDASGAVVGEPQIIKRSGNPWYDEGVVRGIQKASPLPPPPTAGEWDFVFKPEDAL